MAYSAERLAKAQRLFPSQTRAVFESGDTYDLRSRTKNTTSAISSWIDNDKDDDYTPHQSFRPKRGTRSDRENRSRTRTAKRPRNHSPHLTSSQEADTDEDAPSSCDTVTTADTTGQSQWERHWQPQTERNPNKAYFFRARKDALGSLSGANIDQNRRSGLFEECKSSTQGCLACQEISLECSLVDNPFHYPCDNCRDDECDCIPDPPPIWKRQCEWCRRRRLPKCSYLSGDYNHSQPCHECLQHGFQCVAGPAKSRPPGGRFPESIATEMTDAAHITEPEETSRRASKRHAKRKSRLQELKDSLPVPATGSSQVTAIQNQPSTQGPWIPDLGTLAGSGLPPPTIPAFGSGGPNPYGTSYRISTYYAHPLTILDINSPLSCHWCSNWAYGIVGLGLRNTEVLDFNTGRLIEIKDGHQGEGKQPSRMCWHCASERLQIMRCCHDDIAPMFKDMNLKTYHNASEAFHNLAQARAALQELSSRCYGQPFPHTDRQWCSLCREPAFWSCDSDQTAQACVQGVTQFVNPVGIGCGLYLCHYCAHHVKRFHGDLDRTVRWAKQDPDNGTECRADVNYILKSSSQNYLLRHIHKH